MCCYKVLALTGLLAYTLLLLERLQSALQPASDYAIVKGRSGHGTARQVFLKPAAQTNGADSNSELILNGGCRRWTCRLCRDLERQVYGRQQPLANSAS